MRKNIYSCTSTGLKVVAIVGIFIANISNGVAQSAADPKAIDFTARMDTVVSYYGISNSIFSNLNVADKNGDLWEDLEVATFRGDIGQDQGSNLRFGGSRIFDPVGNPRIAGQAALYGDFNGDGISDIVDRDGKFHKGLPSSPYFDSIGGAYLAMHGFPVSLLIGAIDFDGDGILDILIQQYSTASYLALYKGKPSFGTDSIYQYPDDSLVIKGIISGTVAQFNPSLHPEIIFYAGIRTGRHIGMLHSHVKLFDDTVHWLTDTSASPEINVQNIYTTDITGDGIPDLLVSDGEYVYIFKGGDDFGSYKLTKENAYYIIPNPRLIDVTGKFLEVNGFGSYIHALGDLSGSGIPYILIEAALTDNVGVAREYGMIYAGGKALDSLYDGIVIFPDALSITLDTLHSIDSTGRSALIIVHNHNRDIGFGVADMLLYRGCDSLPHRTNPTFAVEPHKMGSSTLAMSTFPSIAQRYVKVHLISSRRTRGELAVYDLLGRSVLSRSVEIDPGENIEYFETSGLANGTYVARLSGSQIATTQSTKFIVSH
jgi:hypothetical protein